MWRREHARRNQMSECVCPRASRQGCEKMSAPESDRRGAAIARDDEGPESAIGVADGEHIIGSNAELVHAVVAINLRAHHPRLFSPLRVLGRALQKKLCVQKLKAGSLPDRALQGN